MYVPFDAVGAKERLVVTGRTGQFSFQKPAECSILFILLLAGGGAGGNGFSGASGTFRGGGGGGGGGGYGFFVCPAMAFPDQTFITAGRGGSPGATGGGVTAIRLANQNRTIIQIDGAVGGGNGTASSAGTFGAAGAYNTLSNAFVNSCCMRSTGTANGGQAGGAQTGAAGGNGAVSFFGGSGGAGGGGVGSNDTAFDGGNGGTSLFPAFNNILGGLASGARDGAGNIFGVRPLPVTVAGTGGASSGTGAGGAGGHGAWGCGGGGGGAGVTGGGGGSGGDGLALLWWI
jgi:hypothetical protein